MLENVPNIYPETELIGINNDNSFDSKINEEFIKSDTFKSINNDVKNFFTCSSCSKIIEKNSVCINCNAISCLDCSKTFLSCKTCHTYPYKGKENEDISYTSKKLFDEEEDLVDNLNYSVLSTSNIKNQFKENKLRNIIKDEETDYLNISLDSRKFMLDNISDISFSEHNNKIDNKYSIINLFDIMEEQGKMMKAEIKESKKIDPKRYIEINEALKEDKNSNIFVSGLLAKFLMNQGIEVAIEKKQSKSVEYSVMKWLATGLYKTKIITIHFDYGKEINKKILKDKKLRNNFIKSWILILSEELNINPDNIYFKKMFKGSGNVSFAVPGCDEKKLKNIQKGREGIKDIKYELLLHGCIISPDMFDTRYNNDDRGWAKKGEKRGGRRYDPPYGWSGYGLNVLNRYDNKNNTWLGMSNVEGEWWVAYHGIGRANDSEKNKKAIKSIVYDGFKRGNYQVHEKYDNCNTFSKEKYSKVGIGIYLTDEISEAEYYSGKVEFKNQKYKIAFMCRVCPKEVRISSKYNKYFVVDPDEKCVRPYRILFKECKE